MRKFLISVAVVVGLVTGGAGVASAAPAVVQSIEHVTSAPAAAPLAVQTEQAPLAAAAGTQAATGDVETAGIGQAIIAILKTLGKWFDDLVNVAKKGWAAFLNFWTNTVPGWIKWLLNGYDAYEIYKAIACYVLGQSWAC
ncbi:hypothetical protein [Lentzea sp. NPDC051838]|uniref:hypothetical protein n=1 Tax=Lentzea sp. NPDC051838 TaxID=3154849 RepID=UPI00343C13C4